MLTLPEDQAYPCLDNGGDYPIYFNGLSKREYFAGLALQGLLANPSIASSEKEATIKAIAMADALIENLNASDVLIPE